MPSQIRVLPLARRCAPEIYGLKKSNNAGSLYCQTISLVRRSTSMPREKVAGLSRRWVPLSKIRMLPLGSGRGSCCWAKGGLPSCQMMLPVARSIITTAEADEDVAVRGLGHRVAVGPFGAMV